MFCVAGNTPPELATVPSKSQVTGVKSMVSCPSAVSSAQPRVEAEVTLPAFERQAGGCVGRGIEIDDEVAAERGRHAAGKRGDVWSVRIDGAGVDGRKVMPTLRRIDREYDLGGRGWHRPSR